MKSLDNKEQVKQEKKKRFKSVLDETILNLDVMCESSVLDDKQCERLVRIWLELKMFRKEIAL